MTAFHDDRTHAICLVTDDISDQDVAHLLEQVSMAGKGRPVHCIYITVADRVAEDKPAIDFLQSLANLTRGSFKLVSIGRHGIESITAAASSSLASHPLLHSLTGGIHGMHGIHGIHEQLTGNHVYPTAPNSFSSQLLCTSHQATTPRTLLTTDGKVPMCSMAWSRFRPIRMFHDGTVCGLNLTSATAMNKLDMDITYTPDIAQLLVNKTVLARSTLDGYYYKGKVISQVNRVD